MKMVQMPACNSTRPSTVVKYGSGFVLILLVLSILAILLPLNTVQAQGETPPIPSDDEVNALAKQMYCPVCENTPLDVCPTQACAEWRELIRDKLVLGWSEDKIKDYFVLQYGDRVLSSPPARGLNWLVYFFPPLAFLGGIILLYKAFVNWKKPSSPSSEPDTLQEPSDEYTQILEEELRNL